jgi:hypothetical protein
MPANRFNGFSEFGIGVGPRVRHYRAAALAVAFEEGSTPKRNLPETVQNWF